MHSNFTDTSKRGFERLIYDYNFLYFFLIEQLVYISCYDAEPQKHKKPAVTPSAAETRAIVSM